MNSDIVDLTKAALAPLWSLAPPGPDNLIGSSAFVTFKQFCTETFPAADKGLGFSFGLSDALRGAGLPCAVSGQAVAATLVEGARAIVSALSATTARKRYLCPLNNADRLPSIQFGNVTIRRYNADTLMALFDGERLARCYPGQPFDVRRLAEFQWLVVEEVAPVAARAGQRALPFLYESLNRDFGAIDPHSGGHPRVVEDALFALLLAPWEDWHSIETDWRGFDIPWIHVATDDLFVRPKPVPSPETLTWEDAAFEDDDGYIVEYQRPFVVPLDAASGEVLEECDQEWWEWVTTATAHPLFETPVEHFLVRAAASEGMDQIMAHMTAIEAALGLQSDFSRKGRPKADQMGATARLAKRVEVLLRDTQAGSDYAALFELRSAFVHGRQIAGLIPSRHRNLARSLARRVVVALIEAANGAAAHSQREDFLTSLA